MTPALMVRGCLHLLRPVAELAIVFELAGLEITIANDQLSSQFPALSLKLTSRPGQGHKLQGSIHATPTAARLMLHRLALALEADGIEFKLELLSPQDKPRATLLTLTYPPIAPGTSELDE